MIIFITPDKGSNFSFKPGLRRSGSGRPFIRMEFRLNLFQAPGVDWKFSPEIPWGGRIGDDRLCPGSTYSTPTGT